MGALGDLIIRLTADTADATGDIGKAAHQIERDMQSMAIRATAAGELIGRSIAGLATHFVAAAKEAVEFGDKLSKMSERTNISVERLSEVAFAGKLADVAVGQLTSGLGQFNKFLSDSGKESSKAARLFEALGVSVNEGPQVAFDQFAAAINALPDGETKVAAMRAAFGRSGDALIPLIAGLDEASEKARRLGLVMSKEMAANSANFNDSMTTLGASTQGLMINSLGPTIAMLAEMTTNLSNAAAQGNLLKGVFFELGRVGAATLGGIAKLLGDDKVETQAFNAFNSMKIQPLPGAAAAVAAPNIDQEKLKRALAGINAAGKGRGGGAMSFDELMARNATKRVAVFEEAERKATEIAEREEENRKKLHADGMQAYFKWIDDSIKLEEKAMQLAGGFDGNDNPIKERMKTANDAARELGITFSSAFEDAVVGASKLSDVLKGLEQDIIRIVTRKMVTEPLAKSLEGMMGGGIDFGKIGSTIMSWLPSFDVGTDYVPRDMMAVVHKGEAIVPAAQNRGGMSGGTPIVMNVYAQDAGSFNASRGQVLAGLQAASSIAMRRNR